MNDSMADAFAPAEEHHRNIVIHNTWGHLFPDKKQYKGKVRIAISLYGGDCGIIDEKDLPQSSPWWFEAITTFAFEVGKDMEAGEVAEFDIQVDIVDCAEEAEDDIEAEEQMEGEPDTWTEIHIKQLAKIILIGAW